MVMCVTSCNKVCYFVTCFRSNSEVCENPIGGRSWFVTSVGLEVFSRKNLVFIISFPYFCWIFASGCVTNSLSEQGLSLFPETCENLTTQFTPLLWLCIPIYIILDLWLHAVKDQDSCAWYKVLLFTATSSN